MPHGEPMTFIDVVVVVAVVMLADLLLLSSGRYVASSGERRFQIHDCRICCKVQELCRRLDEKGEASSSQPRPVRVESDTGESVAVECLFETSPNSTAFLQNRLLAFAIEQNMPHIFDELFTPESLAQFVQETGDLIKNASVCQLTPYFAEVWNWSQVSLSLLCKYY